MSQTSSEETEAIRQKNRFGKGTELTKVFDDWEAVVQAFFLTKTAMEESETPLVGYRQPLTDWPSNVSRIILGKDRASNWFLLTSKRLIWANPNEQFQQLWLENIQSVGWSSGPPGWTGRDESSPPDTLVYIANGKGHCKHYSPWLHVIDMTGKRHEVFLEPGESVRALRNIIWHLSGGWSSALARAEEANREAQSEYRPIKGSDAYKAARSEYKFLKNGDSYANRLFKNLDSNIQTFFLAQAQLDQDEIPVLGFFDNQETWLLETTRSVWWSRPGFKFSLRYGQITGMGLVELEALGPAPEVMDEYWIENWEERKEKVSCIKLNSPWLYIDDSEGSRHEVLLPPGGTLFAIWNSIRYMQLLERIHPSRQSKH